jgi:alcohol dehydrogenase class IV
MAVNIRALRARFPESPALGRFREIAAILTGDPDAIPEDGADWVRELVEALLIPKLGHYGIRPHQISEIAQKAARASSMKANPVELTAAELANIMEQSI